MALNPHLVMFVMCGALVLASPGRSQETVEKVDPKGVEFFEAKIRPVLVGQCYQCHSAGAKSLKGGLLLDTRDGLRQGGDSGSAVVPGNSDESLLIEALQYEGLEMPPKGKLPDDIIADFVKWVRMGAPDPRDGKAPLPRTSIDVEAGRRFWAFQPPKMPALPSVRNAAWPRSDLDRFVLAALEANGIKPVGDADRRTLIRRLSFDLTGLPPSPQEMEAFLADTSASAVAKLVDRLLASPQFGERWGRHWLDIARYGESTGKERNVPFPYAWRYRDYVIDAFNADTPYDEFIRQQVAGDLLPAADEAQKLRNQVATGFLALGPKGVNERNREQYAMDVVDEQIDVVSRAILACTVSCARCHDHKFDPIPTADYYALAGIFRSTQTLSGVKPGSRGPDIGELLQLATSDDQPPAVQVKPPEPSPEDAKKIKRFEQQLAKAREEFESLREKAKKLKGEKGDKAALTKIAAQTKQAKAKVQQFEERLAKFGASGGSNRLPDNAVLVMAVRDADRPVDCQICIRGEVNDRGAEVPRGFVSVVSRQQIEIPDDQSGRLQLAQRLSSRENPLTARVMANRIWQHLFGVGIVETVDNFGELGERPTHPELLDYLAVRFMDEGWSIKRMIREIVLSRTYQLSSDHSETAYATDPENRLLWRASRRRLDGESIRDAVLAASGGLDRSRPAGSPVMQLASGEIGRRLDISILSEPSNHRSVYLPVLRGIVPEMLSVFDMADPNLVVGQRDMTTVATQALYMMNSPFVLDQAEKMGRLLLDQQPTDVPARIALAYERTLSRPPDSDEADRAAAYLADYSAAVVAEGKSKGDAELAAWTSFCQTLFSSAEFRYVY